MEFADITIVDVRVEPATPADHFRLQFVLSRVPERFWPERFMAAYTALPERRRIEVSEAVLQLTLPGGEVEEYAASVGQAVREANVAYRAEMARRAAEQQERLAVEEQRAERALALRDAARRRLGL
jgi:hypothetical protein